MTTPAAPQNSDANRGVQAPPNRRALGLVLTVLVAALGGILVVRAPVDSKSLPVQASASTTASTAIRGAAPARCRRVGEASYRLGRGETAVATDEGEDDLPAAFGAEVGRAVALGDGFALGVRHDEGNGASAGVLLLEGEAKNGKLVDLGRSRGDFDAPLVTAIGHDGKTWLAGVLEPNASSLTLRIATGDAEGKPTWQLELEQGRDESFAFDISSGAKTIAVTWDDVTRDGKLSRVRLAALSPDAKSLAKKPAVLSQQDIDAETPKVVARSGGFWLAYLARKALALPDRADDASLDRSANEDRYSAEKIDPSWIELVPLDEAAAPVGRARAVTPEQGHVLSFDLALGADGGALITWRDDDTPAGAHGGHVSLMLVTASGGTQTQLVADQNVGSGVPRLLPGWIALNDAAGRAMLAPIADDGAVAGELGLELMVGQGDPLAARGNRLLVATSAGKAVDLTVVECAR